MYINMNFYKNVSRVNCICEIMYLLSEPFFKHFPTCC